MLIRDFRIQNGWNQSELAEILNTSQAAISRLEVVDKETSVFSIEDVKNISNATGFSVGELLELLGVDL